jgi:hypothetical protein
MSFPEWWSTLMPSSQDFSPPLLMTTSIGDFDLSVGSSKPSKVIQSHGDWTITWNATASAISVVSAQADIFAKNLTKIGKILRIFDELDKIKSR